MFTKARRMDVSTGNGEGPERTVTPALVGEMVMYEYRQSRGRLTGGLKSALRLYAHQQQQVRRYTQAAVLESLIESTRGQIVQVIIEAQTASPEKQTELLDLAKSLGQNIKKMRKQVAHLI